MCDALIVLANLEATISSSRCTFMMLGQMVSVIDAFAREARPVRYEYAPRQSICPNGPGHLLVAG
jgi:hypothetical protein